MTRSRREEKKTYSDGDRLDRVALLSGQLERAIDALLLKEGRQRLGRFCAAHEGERGPWTALPVDEGVYVLYRFATSDRLGEGITPGISREVGRHWCRTRSAEPPVARRGRRVHGE